MAGTAEQPRRKFSNRDLKEIRDHGPRLWARIRGKGSVTNLSQDLAAELLAKRTAK